MSTKGYTILEFHEPYPGSRWHFFKNEGDVKVTDVLQTAVHTKNELSDNCRSDKVIHIRMTVLLTYIAPTSRCYRGLSCSSAAVALTWGKLKHVKLKQSFRDVHDAVPA